MRRESARYYLAGFVSIITFLVYLPALQNNFVEWDDSLYVYDNPNIHSLNASFFKWAFSTFYASNWHPLTWISHTLDYVVWGLNPTGHHLTNNILHASNTFLVVVLVSRLLESWQASKLSSRQADELTASHDARFTIISAAAAGLLFGLHPIHVESVEWVAERKDLLCALFFLLSIMMYMRYITPPAHSYVRRGPSRRCYILSLLYFALALMSKPMAVSLPLVLLILDWYPFERIRSVRTLLNAVGEKVPFIALALVSSILTLRAQSSGSAMYMMGYLPLSTRMLVAGKSLIAYLWNMAFPFDLSPYYPYPLSISPFSLEFFPSVVLVLVITILCLLYIKRHKAWTAFWGYYVATLIPVLGIVQVGGQAMADRYTYLPSISPFLLAGALIAWLFELQSKPGTTTRILTRSGFAAALLLVVGMSYLTISQISVWKNSLTLWNFVIEREPGRVPQAYNNRGIALIDEGRYREAIEDFNEAISLNPAYYEAYGNRSAAYDKTGQLDKALADMDRAVSLSSFYKAYYARGRLFEKKGEVEKAVGDYRQAISHNPLFIDAYIDLGLLYNKTGSYKNAEESFRDALAIDPDQDYAHYCLGKALADSGDLNGALGHISTAVRLRPDNALYRNMLGITLGQKGLFANALEQFREAVRLDPSESAYRENLEKALSLNNAEKKTQ